MFEPIVFISIVITIFSFGKLYIVKKQTQRYAHVRRNTHGSPR